MISARAQAIAILVGTAAGERTRPPTGAAGADARDDALVRELVAGANLHYRLYDHLAARFLQPRPQPPLLTMALRVGCHQLFALDRVPPHAAVSETVAGLRDAGGPKLVSVANAVLRRLSELRIDERDADGPVGRLRPEVRPGDSGLAHSLPALLVRDLAPLLDADPARRLSDLNRRAPLCTRTRPRRPDPIGHSILRRDGPWTWWEDPAEALAWVAEGVCTVQDRSQGEVADLAASVGLAGPGALVCDLCAAPGGKSLALADLGCRVVAADSSRERLRDLDSLASDLPMRLAQDGLHPALPAQAFDVVLVDAPCSNSGVFARRPEAKQRYDERHLASLAIIQRGLLAAAAGLARPEGRLVYATCSLSPAENQGVAHSLPGWRLRGERLRWPDAWSGGGYCAVLVRN